MDVLYALFTTVGTGVGLDFPHDMNLSEICALIFTYQEISPAGVLSASACILLSVCILLKIIV
jgi:hypothetical protein